jgi:hypothetical protein
MAVSRVQPGLGQSNPPHPAQPVAALGGTEDLFDPAAHVADLCVMRLETIEGCLAAPGACLHSARYTATGNDQPLTAATGKSAVAIHVTRVRRQRNIQQGSIVDVGGGHLHRLNQDRLLIVAGVDPVSWTPEHLRSRSP